MNKKIREIIRAAVKVFCVLLGIFGAYMIYMFASSFTTVFTGIDFGFIFFLMFLLVGVLLIFVAYQNIFKYSIESINSLTMIIGFFTYGMINHESMKYLKTTTHKDNPLFVLVCVILPIIMGWGCHRLLKAFLTRYTIGNKTQIIEVEQEGATVGVAPR